ncbi:histidine kinase dimerization/phospho-acceptor domain-containing protein [Mangrovicoccus algicola]|uniref:histidine kinase n=1 Tax=Mangrovicoccus algicola TaxID=2771008 RepID=A0A8J6ZA60_9RHOB|nr:histidine kinase dimerization/phospho-acceptor domain-containing protein [Mangrovicoccus algicola]MBE3638936.1 hypothetical protein [Mangrovicoccus algicola]
MRELVHDLRSPLTALQLGTETLLERSADTPERVILEQMLSDIGRLARMLESVDQRYPPGLPALLTRELAAAAAALKARGSAVTLELAAGLPSGTAADPARAAAIARLAWATAARIPDGQDVTMRLRQDAGGLFWETEIRSRGTPLDSPPSAGRGSATLCHRLRLRQGQDAPQPS